MQRTQQRLREQRKAGAIATRLPKRELKYDIQWLELADQYVDISGQMIINPRNIHATSLMEADGIWMRDFARYRQLVKYFEDEGKRQEIGLK